MIVEKAVSRIGRHFDAVVDARGREHRLESDVARSDGFRYDLATRWHVIREAAGRGKPLMETASAWLGITRRRWAGRAVRLRKR